MKLKTSMERKVGAQEIKTREELEELQANDRQQQNHSIQHQSSDLLSHHRHVVILSLSRTVIEFSSARITKRRWSWWLIRRFSATSGNISNGTVASRDSYLPDRLRRCGAGCTRTDRRRKLVRACTCWRPRLRRPIVKAILVEHFEERHGMMYNSLRPHFYLWMCVDLQNSPSSASRPSSSTTP